MQLTVTSVVTSLVSGMTLWNFSAKYYILFRLDIRMLLKQGTRNGKRAREREEEKSELHFQLSAFDSSHFSFFLYPY